MKKYYANKYSIYQPTFFYQWNKSFKFEEGKKIDYYFLKYKYQPKYTIESVLSVTFEILNHNFYLVNEQYTLAEFIELYDEANRFNRKGDIETINHIIECSANQVYENIKYLKYGFSRNILPYYSILEI